MFSWIQNLLPSKSKNQSFVSQAALPNITTLEQIPSQVSRVEMPSEFTLSKESLSQISEFGPEGSGLENQLSRCYERGQKETSIEKKMVKRRSGHRAFAPSLARASRPVPKTKLSASDYSTLVNCKEKPQAESTINLAKPVQTPVNIFSKPLNDTSNLLRKVGNVPVRNSGIDSTVSSLPKLGLNGHSLMNMPTVDKENRFQVQRFKKNNHSTVFPVQCENISFVFVSQRKLSECFSDRMLSLDQFRLGAHTIPIMQTLNQLSSNSDLQHSGLEKQNRRLPFEITMSCYNLIAKCVVGLKLKERSWFLAIHLFDRLSALSAMESAQREIYCIVCVMIAAKVEHIRYPRPVMFLRSSGVKASVSHLVNTEGSILGLLNYRLITVLIYDFYVIFSGVSRLSDSAKSLGMFVLKAYLCVHPPVSASKPLVAFALCLFLARRFKSPRFWSVVTKEDVPYYSLRLGSRENSKSLPSEEEEMMLEYLFEAKEADAVCEQITEACVRCHVEHYWYIFQVFTTSSADLRLN
jgi:hypothetical protein